jgi:hypothetical protein
VRFFPDREVHAVSPVIGTRVVFSVGAWVEAETEAETEPDPAAAPRRRS